MSILANELLMKAVVTIIFSLILFMFKPIRERLIRYFKKITNKIQYSVNVKGYITFLNSNHNVYNFYSEKSENRFYYEVELPFEDISEDSMPIDESNHLIYEAIKYKYGKDLSSKGGMLNITQIKKIEKYTK
ncbi:MAG TPA: hypothetical protein VK067_04685 [Pseudogracilibacillus sp.]|nr:hypothetical protein [Pseudogracilibacillus sp.]